MLKFATTLILFLLITSCGKVESFNYKKLEGLKIENLDNNNIKVTGNLILNNPNKIGIKLKKIESDIYIENDYITKFILDTALKILPKADFSLPFNVTMKSSALFKNALNMLFNPSFNIKLKGNARVGKGFIFINYPFEYIEKIKL